MSEIAELENELKSIKKQLKGVRKQEEKADKALKKLVKHTGKKQEDITEIFSAYDGWTEQEWQDHRSVNEKIGLAGSEHSRLGAKVSRLKAERKRIKKKLKKAVEAEEKARELEEHQAALEAQVEAADEAEVPVESAEEAPDPAETPSETVDVANEAEMPDEGSEAADEDNETPVETFEAAADAEEPVDDSSDDADMPDETDEAVGADAEMPDEVLEAVDDAEETVEDSVDEPELVIEYSAPRAPEPVVAAPAATTVCGVCGMHPAGASDLCDMCLLLAGLDSPGTNTTDPAVVAHGLAVATHTASEFEPGSPSEAAVRASGAIRGVHVVLVEQIAGVTAGKEADPHFVNAAFAKHLGGLAGSWAMPGIAAGLLESARASHSDLLPQDFGDVLDKVLPDWLRNLWPSHEFSPLRHSFTVESADDQNNMRSECVRCGLKGRGSLFYFEHDGGICGTGACQVCGLSGQFHLIAGRLFGVV